MKALFVFALLAASAASAQPYQYLNYRMLSSPQDPFRYWYNDVDTVPATAGGVDGGLASTKAAFNAWKNVGCSSLGFQFAGKVSANAQIVNPEDAFDTFNVSTSFIADAGDPYYDYALGGGAAISADVALSYQGVLYQCDIYLNSVPNPGTQFVPTWSNATPTALDALDVQTFLTHEVGHCEGLGHSVAGTNDVMRPDLSFGVQIRALSDHDIGQVCNAYPNDGGVGTPCPTGNECGSGFTCVSAPRSDGGTFPPSCTKGCSGTNDCPAPYVCTPSSAVGGSSGACFPPENNVVPVGASCASDAGCDTAYGVCLAGTYPSGNPQWPAGYCSQECSNNSCPAESVCAGFPDGTHACLKECRIGSADCRSGYVCEEIELDAGVSAAVCLGQCHNNNDCSAGSECRTCDGMCIPRQNPTGQMGDPCTSSDTCGAGQFCLFTDDPLTGQPSAIGVCTQSCATACGACPSGTTCHSVAPSGNLYCLRDCQTGTCATGEQCSQVENGNGNGSSQGCLPGCQSSSQCPVGDVCSGGECVTPTPDAGHPPPPDSGTPGGTPDSGSPGGGTPSGGSGGCSAAQSSPFALLGWIIALVLLRRARRCPN